MDLVAEAKANVLRHAGTSLEDSARRLLGPRADRLEPAARDPRHAEALRQLLGPEGPLFQGARLLTVEQRLGEVALALATAALDAEALWRLRRELRVLEFLASPRIAVEIRGLRQLLDGLTEVASQWAAAGVTGDGCRNALGWGGASALTGVFVERLRSPDGRWGDLLLLGLPFVLGYVRDRELGAALAQAPQTARLRHLCALHEALWDLLEQEAAGEPASFEQLRAFDEAIERVMAALRAGVCGADQIAAIGALYRLTLCLRAAQASELARKGIEALKARALRELDALELS